MLRKFLLYLIIILIVNIAFLFSPKPKNNEERPCTYYNLGRLAGFSFSSDAYNFVDRAIDPSLLLEPNDIRQSRPLFVLCGTIVGYSLYYSIYSIHRLWDLIKESPTSKPELFWKFYFGYIIINILILIFSLHIFEFIIKTLINRNLDKLSYILICVILISNQITKAFFWTAHEQMFAILTPVFCIYIANRIYHHKSDSQSTYLISFLTGFFPLLYGSFFLLLPSIMFGYCLFRFQNKLFVISKSLLEISVSSLLFLLPTVIWIVYLMTIGVKFYSDEMGSYHQFVWIIEQYKISILQLLKVSLNNIYNFLFTWKSIYIFIILLIVAILLNSKEMLREITKTEIFQILLFLFVIFVLFFGLMGFYYERLTYNLAPILICLTIYFIGETARSVIFRYGLIIFVVLWESYHLLSRGSYC